MRKKEVERVKLLLRRERKSGEMLLKRERLPRVALWCLCWCEEFLNTGRVWSKVKKHTRQSYTGSQFFVLESQHGSSRVRALHAMRYLSPDDWIECK